MESIQDITRVKMVVKETVKQPMLLTKEEIKLIERLRQLCRRSKGCLVIVEPSHHLSWYVTNDKESS